MPELFLAVSVVGLLLTANAARPSRNQFLMGMSFLPAWLVGELPLQIIAVQAIATALWVLGGALGRVPGWIGLAVTAVSWVTLLRLHRVANQAGSLGPATLDRLLGPGYEARIADTLAVTGDKPRWRTALLPFDLKDPRVHVVRDVVFAEHGKRGLRLDVFHPRDGVTGAPVLLQVHGGAWVIGFKERQALPLMTHLAARGWVCVNIDYRLSPRATFPDHLVDVKRAIAWIREHIAEYGGDPSFVAISGNSAGGHLTALAALTANAPEHQPGFEEIDTRLQAAVPFYGIYDFTNRNHTMPKRWVKDFLGRYVMKASPDDAPELYRQASPFDQVHAAAPPFLVIHGTVDNLAPVADAREFVERLEAVSSHPVAYLEVPGAGHAFDTFHTVRSRAVVDVVSRWLNHQWVDHLEARAG